MTHYIHTSIDIKASREKIWKILINFNNYTNWNPYILMVEGEAAVGNKLKVHLLAPGGKGRIYYPKIEIKTENELLIWRSKVVSRGLIRGKRTFELIDNSNNNTTFIHKEELGGLLTRFYNTENNKAGIIAMNEKLKGLAEK